MDVTKVKELELRKDEFISIASHELKTPLTTIKAYVQIVEQFFAKKTEPKINEFLQKAILHINSLDHIIMDLLDVNRLEHGKMDISLSIFDMDEIVDESIESVRHGSPQHEIIKYGKSRKKVKGDKQRIKQVINNLLSNAMKYSPDADKVEIFVQDKDGHVEVAVKDYGYGINEEDQNKIFERYFRSSRTASQVTGLGIGLYVINEIVKAHNGKIKVESEAGKGSVFTVTIPENVV